MIVCSDDNENDSDDNNVNDMIMIMMIYGHDGVVVDDDKILPL